MAFIEERQADLQPGGPAPTIYGMRQDKAFYSLDAQAGRQAVLILAGKLPPAATLPLAQAFERLAADFARHEADVLLIVDAFGPQVLAYVTTKLRGVQIIFCPTDVFDGWHFDHREPEVCIIDRGSRYVGGVDGDSAPEIAQRSLATTALAAHEPARDAVLPAPVLLIPNIFTAGFCRELIDHFESNPHAVGGMASIDAQGNPIHKIDEGKKKREDFVVEADDPFHDAIVASLDRTCGPEMKRALHFDAAHMDRILIARYDDTGSYFRRHRDNAAPSVAFRQFALSVNLNSDEYDGGYLLFPEYNSHRYKPGRGAGIVFSCSLLHEATPVLRGQRYVLLTFFFDAQSQARRLAGG